MSIKIPLGFALATLLWTSTPADGQRAAKLTSVDVYGARKVTATAILEAAGLEAGKAMKGAARAIEAKVEALDGIAEAQVAVIQYPGHVAAFVGVREEGTPPTTFRPAPTGRIVLDPEIRALYKKKNSHLIAAIRSGKAGEDRDQGHSLSEYPPMREIQMQFVALADERFDELAAALQSSSDPTSRTAAAAVIAYASDKKKVAPLLQHAAGDPDESVRNAGVRALSILAAYAHEHPELEIAVDPDPFLRLLESVVWTDRNKGSAALDALTRSRDPELFATLVERSLDELTEMAVWRSNGHALFSARVVGRLAGLSDEVILETIQGFASVDERIAWVEELTGRIRRENVTGG